MDKAQWVVVSEVVAIAVIELSSSTSFTDLIEGKIALTQTGSTLLGQLTPTAKKALLWIVGSVLAIGLAGVLPTFTVGSVTAVVVLVLVTKEPTIAKYLTSITALIGG